MFFRVYYRRVGVDEERDFQQQTLKQLGSMCIIDSCRGMYVVKIQRKYFYTTHEVKVQVFNDICPHESCNGPTSNTSTIYSAEDLPQVAPTRVNFLRLKFMRFRTVARDLKIMIFWEILQCNIYKKKSKQNN